MPAPRPLAALGPPKAVFEPSGASARHGPPQRPDAGTDLPAGGVKLDRPQRQLGFDFRHDHLVAQFAALLGQLPQAFWCHRAPDRFLDA
jgi:hypothetical protein